MSVGVSTDCPVKIGRVQLNPWIIDLVYSPLFAISRKNLMIQDELDVLCDVSQRLSSAGLNFMVTGSVAMNYYVQPRMTRDIDLVIALSPADAGKIARLFEPDYYVSQTAVANAVARRSMFNLIHQEAVIKIDLIVLKNEPYRLEEFSRRREITIRDFRTWIVSREDLILSKLYWARDSRSEMQLRDVSNLLAGDNDLEYIRSRAALLGVADLLEEVLTRNE